MMTIIYTDYYGVITSPVESEETPYPVEVSDEMKSMMQEVTEEMREAARVAGRRLMAEEPRKGCVFCGCEDFVGDTYECVGCGAS